MISRLRFLYHRFAREHMRLSAPMRPIKDLTGKDIGYIEQVEVSQGHLDVRGWVQADKVTLVLAGLTDTVVPTQHREDVAQALDISPQVGFNLSLPCFYDTLLESAPPGLQVEQASAGVSDIALPFHRGAVLRMRWGMLGSFLWAGLRALPAASGWMLTNKLQYRADVKRAFGLDTVRLAGRLDPAIFHPTDNAPLPHSATKVTIVLPVYNALELLQVALDRVAAHTDLEWRLILIEDASSDPRVRPYLRDWASRQRAQKHDRIDLIENDRNLGFIGSVNAGFDLVLDGFGGDGPVIVLNSDALVPAGWASRLIAPLENNPQVASTTPMTNDGEIVSVPLICQAIALYSGQVDAIDACARQFNQKALLPETPTAVGFCMAISRRWLEQEPRFDASFGHGYGEEVDWCQKTRARGGLHLTVPGLFVEHVGGASFGSEEKANRVARNNGIISSRYPGYDSDVQTFISTDPLRTPRLALGMAWAGSRSDEPVPIYLAHTMGGGAEKYLETRIAEDLEQDLPSVVLRVGGTRHWQVELITPGGQITGSTDDSALVRRLLEPVKRRHIIYSCGVGDRDPVHQPEFLRSLKRSDDDRIEVMFHDYLPLSPSYTLLDSDGIYRGPPIAGETTDRAHVIRCASGDEVSLTEWQRAWHNLAEAADELRVFSRSSAGIVGAVWPDLIERISIRPHRMPEIELRVDPPELPDRPVVAVLGNIGYQKGAKVLREIAQHFDQDRRIGLVLIGKIDPHYKLPESMPVLGSFRLENVPALARKHGVTHWLIPSIWPETFSYATHEMLATGLPVVGFAIGAQGEALGAAANGHSVAFDPHGDWTAALIEVIRDMTGVDR